jgi:Ni/Co efflux regulator RcnB
MSSKTWFRAGAAAVLSLALSTTIAAAQDHGHGHERHDRDDDDDHDREHDRDHDRDRHAYSDRDRDEMRGWYRKHHEHLPPGLAERDQLPPGLERHLVVRGFLPLELQRRMQPCPPELERTLPPPPPNYTHVIIGGHLVLLNRANFQIADVFHFEIN